MADRLTNILGSLEQNSFISGDKISMLDPRNARFPAFSAKWAVSFVVIGSRVVRFVLRDYLGKIKMTVVHIICTAVLLTIRGLNNFVTLGNCKVKDGIPGADRESVINGYTIDVQGLRFVCVCVLMMR